MPNTSRDNQSSFIPNPKSKLFEQVREVMRFHHYSYRTEKTYLQWIRRYLVFHRSSERAGPERGWRHPRTMGGSEVAAYLSHLATRRNVSAASGEC